MADSAPLNSSLDVRFSVPLVHRLRFTHDVFSTEADVLLQLLESADGQPARAQFWIDSQVAEGHPELQQRIFYFMYS